MLKRLWLRVVLALTPFLPKQQAPTTAEPREQPIALRHDEIDENEVETAAFAAHRTNGEQYAGARTSTQEQLNAMMRASGKGKRFLNASLSAGGVREEREQFIADRMRDL